MMPKQIFKKFPAVIIALSMLMVQATAQQTTHQVGGLVADEYGKPLAGVRVHTRGDSETAFTNADGVFHLTVTIGRPLIFSAPNFDEQERLPKGDTVLPVRLTRTFLRTPAIDPTKSLTKKDTIIVPMEADDKIDVLYERTSRESFLGSISTVGSNQLEASAASNYLFALQGRLTGLNITQ